MLALDAASWSTSRLRQNRTSSAFSSVVGFSSFSFHCYCGCCLEDHSPQQPHPELTTATLDSAIGRWVGLLARSCIAAAITIRDAHLLRCQFHPDQIRRTLLRRRQQRLMSMIVLLAIPIGRTDGPLPRRFIVACIRRKGAQQQPHCLQRLQRQPLSQCRSQSQCQFQPLLQPHCR